MSQIVLYFLHNTSVIFYIDVVLTLSIWWRDQMETFFALLALFAGNSLPSERPVTRSIGVFFNLSLNKRLSKQSWGLWFETPSRSLLRPCNYIPYLRLDHLEKNTWSTSAWYIMVDHVVSSGSRKMLATFYSLSNILEHFKKIKMVIIWYE